MFKKGLKNHPIEASGLHRMDGQAKSGSPPGPWACKAAVLIRGNEDEGPYELALEYRFNAVCQSSREATIIKTDAAAKCPSNGHGFDVAWISIRAGTFVTTTTGITQLKTNFASPLNIESG